MLLFPQMLASFHPDVFWQIRNVALPCTWQKHALLPNSKWEFYSPPFHSILETGVHCKGYFKDHMPATSSSVLSLHVFWTSLAQAKSGSKADWVASHSSKPCSAGTAMQLEAEGPSGSTLRASDFECAKIKAADNWNLHLHHPQF